MFCRVDANLAYVGPSALWGPRVMRQIREQPVARLIRVFGMNSASGFRHILYNILRRVSFPQSNKQARVIADCQ